MSNYNQKKASKKNSEVQSNVLNEDALLYASNKVRSRIKNFSVKEIKRFPVHTDIVMNSLVILSDAAAKPENQMTAIEKMDMVRIGVSKKDLESLKVKTKLDYDKLAKALSVTRATLINKKGKEKFNAALSEHIVGLADIYSYGYEVFEDEDRFNQWMFRPNQALGGQTPYHLIDNQYGREEIKNIIGRIDYGVYS